MHPQSIDISCPLGPQQQTCSSGFAAVVVCCCGPMLWQTDRWTDTVPFHRCCSAQYTDNVNNRASSYTHTHTRLTALFPGLPRWASTRKGKPIWILLKHETVSGSDISWAICKSSLQADNHASTPPLSFLQAGCPSCRPTVTKHWRQATY